MLKTKSFIIYLIFCLISLCVAVHADDAKVLDNPELLEYVQTKLPHHGILQKKETGFTYLKVDDAYIHALFELIEEKGYVKPSYFRRADAPGAHISVLYEDEIEQFPTIPGIGKMFHFEIMRLASVRTRYDQLIILQVYCPQLERYRSDLGLSAKLHNHEFHITIAKKPIKKTS